MSKLYNAYNRHHARMLAICVLEGKPYRRKPRYMEGWIYARQPEQWLRVVGHVVPEFRHYEIFQKRDGDHGGWYTNNHGESWKDGDGLCWGVVMQLPGRRGVARFVAGYEFGGCGFVNLDRSRIFEEPMRGDDCGSGGTMPACTDAARAAARHADQLAHDAAEKEREYQEEQEEEDAA